MEKMLRMMDKFETLLSCDRDSLECISHRDYTNFSVSEILKPEFGQNYQTNCLHQKIANVVSSTDDLSDVSSESDESTNGDVNIRYAQTPENRCSPPSTRVRKNAYVAEEPLFMHSYADVKPFSMLDRIRRQNLEEDGYSSSDSESALDLRIERKKTPPKNSVPAWVFCTRYSDRPSAGEGSLFCVLGSFFACCVFSHLFCRLLSLLVYKLMC